MTEAEVKAILKTVGRSSSIAGGLGGIAVEVLLEQGLEMIMKLWEEEKAFDMQTAKENLRKLEKEKYEIMNSKEFAKEDARAIERLKLLNKDIDKLIKENKISKDEASYEKSKGRIDALYEKEKYEGPSDEQKSMLEFEKEIASSIKTGIPVKSGWTTQSGEMAIEEQKIKASSGSNKKKKTQKETSTGIQIEAGVSVGGNEIIDNLKKREEAMKNLAEFDERTRISSLTGEAQKQAQLLANYNKQKAEIDAMHEAQLLYAEDEIRIKEEQQSRLLGMETAYLAEKDAIHKEFAEMEIIRRVQEEEAARAAAEQQKLYEEEQRAAKLQATADSLNCMQQLFEGNSKYAALYKASAIGEATINATQSVLKTMASVPYPFNIPLAALQSAVALQRVSKIASTKMYRGGMIPGMNTLLMANEQGREAILNTRAVRAVGGEAGVNALNSGMYNSNNSYDNRQTSTIVINTSIMTQKAFRDEIEPILRRAERRR